MHISPHVLSSYILKSTLLEYFARTPQCDVNPKSTTLVLKKGHVIQSVHTTFHNQIEALALEKTLLSKKVVASFLMQGLREGSFIYTVEMNNHSFRVYGTKKAKNQLESGPVSERAELGNASFTELKEEDLEELDTVLKSTLEKESAPSSQREEMPEPVSPAPDQETVPSVRVPLRKKDRSMSSLVEAAVDAKQSELKKAIARNMAEDTKAQDTRKEQEKKKKVEEREVQKQEERLLIHRQEQKKKELLPPSNS